MKRSVALLFLLFGILLLIPAAALAQEASPTAVAGESTGSGDNPVVSATITDKDDSLLLKVNGDTAVASGDTIQNAAVINGNVTVAGTIEENLFVTKGDAVISGTVKGTVTVVRGTLTLENGSSVDDVMLIDSTLNRADGATVTGKIEDRGLDFSFGRGLAVFSALWWVGMTIVALVAAAIFAWLGRLQLFASVETLKNQFAKSLITAIVMWILLPLLAVLVLFTLVGAPLGLLILLVLLPILQLIGLIVVGTWLGSYLLKPTSTGRAIGAAMLGTLILLIVSLIPFVAFVTVLAAMLGSGAFVYRALVNRNATQAVPGWQAV